MDQCMTSITKLVDLKKVQYEFYQIKSNIFFWFYIIILTVAVCISTEHKFQALENLFWYPFPLGSVSKHFTKNEMKKLELNCTVCDLQLTIMPLKQNSYLM